jgi:iron(III) transport system substrate-binding protein
LRLTFRALALTISVLSVAACGSASSSPPPSASASTAPSAAASGSASEAPTGTLTIYAGRSEELVGPLIEDFQTSTGVEVKVEYAGTTDLAATILEEGDASPADIFFAQDAGALGAVAAEGQLATLPADTLAKVDARFVSDEGQWVGVSGRARVVIYDTRALNEADLPDSIAAFTDPAWKGRIGWAPTNASLQSFVTAFRVLEGDAAARAWLEGVQANEPKVYDGNDAVLAAVAAGEVEVGFVNHYYLMRQLAEQGESFPVRNHFLTGSDPGALINVAGAAILSSSDAEGSARRFIEFLLSPDSQSYFAQETFEYPLVAGIDGPAGAPPLDQIQTPDIDLSDLSDLQGTLRLLNDTGVLP